MNLKRFDPWERESLKLFRRQDLDILLNNFVAKQNQGDFLHNLADMLVRLKESLSKTQHLGDVALSGSSNNNFTAHSDSPKVPRLICYVKGCFNERSKDSAYCEVHSGKPS